MTRFVGVLSGKGGVAKTTTVLNLGAAFNYFGRDVIIVDGNLSTPNLGLLLGVPVVPINLHHVLKGKNHIGEAVYMHESGLKIIPAGLSVGELLGVNPDKLSEVLPALDGLADIVIVDGSAGLGREALGVVKAVDDIIVVTNPELPSVTDALKMIRISKDMGKFVKGVVVTKTGRKYDISTDNVLSMLESPVLGEVPHDKAIRESLIQKDPVIYTHPKSKSAVAYKRIAADLIGVEYEEKSRWFDFLRR